MALSIEEKKGIWKPSVHAMISIIPMGKRAGYYASNPESMYKGNKRKLKNVLAQRHIHDKAELKKSIEWNIAVGNRCEFQNLYEELMLLSEAERIRKIEVEKNPKEKQKLTVVNYYLRRMPRGGIGACDYTITVFHCLIGGQLRWLTKDEVWSYAGKLVCLAKENYDSWHDYCTGFAVGLECYVANGSVNYAREGKQFLVRLLNSEASPMVQTKL
ncbi:hypothetical protein D3C80_1070680 [compost metagenome]